MNQAQFRIGGVYRDGIGDLYELQDVRVAGYAESLRRNEYSGAISSGAHSGMHRLSDGRVNWSMNEESQYHLLPGELQFKDGQWVAVEEDKQIDPLFAAAHYEHDLIPAVQEEKIERLEPTPATAVPEWLRQLRVVHAAQGFDGTWNADEYMLGMFNGLELALAIAENRDPQYRTLKPTAPAVPASTAKPALAALSRISSMSHMLGNGIKG